MLGQNRLIQLWEQLFSIYGIHIGQMLLTRADMEDRERFLNARDSVSGLGTGGMSTKLQAADVACRTGIDTIIAAGSRSGVIADVIVGQPVGTRFHAIQTPLENRKRWIFGALAAVLERGSSLLPKGIREVRGNFSRGEVIRIRSLQGRDIAHGVSRYNSDALRIIAGHHIQQIGEILGYDYGPVAVHRDDMIVS
nr:Outer membrane pore protein E precursor [Candidatus Pantoea persica]